MGSANALEEDITTISLHTGTDLFFHQILQRVGVCVCVCVRKGGGTDGGY